MRLVLGWFFRKEVVIAGYYHEQRGNSYIPVADHYFNLYVLGVLIFSVCVQKLDEVGSAKMFPGAWGK